MGFAAGQHAKTSRVVRNQLLAPRDLAGALAVHGDARFVDLSPEHRQRMRDALYRSKRFVKATYSVAERHNYADEEYPAWKSSFTTDYPPREIASRERMQEARKNFANMTSTHFECRGGWVGSAEPSMQSTTQRDYSAKRSEKLERPSAAENARVLPDDAEDPSSTCETEYSRSYPVNTVAAPTTFTSKANESHIRLGGDEDTPPLWATVTKQTYRSYDNVSCTRVSRDWAPSRVLENPDLPVTQNQTTTRSVHTLPSNMDRNSLIIDNKETVRDLKSTHFSFGSDESRGADSQYRASFKPKAGRAEPPAAVKHQGSAVPLRETEEDGKLATSYALDFPKHCGSKEAASVRVDLKQIHGASSILFGSDIGTAPTRSVTQSHFAPPGVVGVRPARWRPAAEEDGDRVGAAMSAEPDPPGTRSASAAVSVTASEYTWKRASIVSGGCGAGRGDNVFLGGDGTEYETQTMRSYGAPPASAVRGYAIRGGPAEAGEWKGRLERVDGQYVTESAAMYVAYGGAAATPSRARQRHTGNLLEHPYGLQRGGGGVGTTEAKRSYVAPEVMVAQQ